MLTMITVVTDCPLGCRSTLSRCASARSCTSSATMSMDPDLVPRRPSSDPGRNTPAGPRSVGRSGSASMMCGWEPPPSPRQMGSSSSIATSLDAPTHRRSPSRTQPPSGPGMRPVPALPQPIFLRPKTLITRGSIQPLPLGAKPAVLWNSYFNSRTSPQCRSLLFLRAC